MPTGLKRRFNLRSMTLMALAAGILIYAGWLFLWLLALPTDGISGVSLAHGISISQAGPWNPSLQAGDLITHIDGHDVRYALYTPGRWYGWLFDQQASAHTYTIMRGERSISADVTWQQPTLSWLLAHSATFLILGTVFVFSGAFIVWRRGQFLPARLMALTLIVEGLNMLNNMVLVNGINTAMAISWLSTPIDLLSFGLVFSSLLHCFAFFPETKWMGRRLPRLLYLIHPLNPLLGLAYGLAVGGRVPLSVRSAMLSGLYMMAGIELLVALGNIVHTYLTTQKTGVRNQIRWLIWGLAVGVAPWLFLYNFAYLVWGKPLLPMTVAITPLALIPLSLIFSIARYGLMKIDTLINRSLVYGLLTVVLVAANLLAASMLSTVLSRMGIEKNEAATIILTIVLTILIVGAMRGLLQRSIDRLFFKERLGFQNLLREMGERLSTTLVFDNLATLLTDYIPARLKLSRAVLLTVQSSEPTFAAHPRNALSLAQNGAVANWLRREGRLLVISQFAHPSPELAPELDMLAQANIEICVPLRRAEKLVGAYALGAKSAGDLYDDHEVDTLILLSHQISSALENTRLYREVEEYNRTLESQVEARTQELRKANKNLADTAWDLAEQRARLDAILQTVADGLVVTDLNDRIVLINPTFAQIVSKDALSLKGTLLADIFAGHELMQVVHQARAQVHPSFSGQVKSAAGRIYKASAHALAQGPAVIGVTTVLHDITHEVEVDHMKTDFISTVSHELRTPLTSVLGFAKLIRRNFESTIMPALEINDHKVQHSAGRIVQNLEIIESESQRLTRLINDVLDIAKMEAGKVDWQMADMQIQHAIETAVSASASLLEGKPLHLCVNVEPNLPTITADLDRTIQVITNLLSNAVKFTEQGEITVSAWQLNPGDDIPPQGARSQDCLVDLPAPIPMLAVSVTDTGIGIQAEDMPQVFEKFRQVGDVLTGRPNGTGLGLPICREIVEHHGGRIWVESSPGTGSRFVFTLPIKRTEAVTERRPAAPELASEPQHFLPEEQPSVPEKVTARPDQLPFQVQTQEIRQRVSEALPLMGDRQPTILVVDDEPTIRLLLNEELIEAGYRVIEAAEGLAAVQLARAAQPDLILLDVMMPGLSGFDVTSVLKADERTKHIPILILSIIEDRERGFRLGADDYLTKPVRTEKLLESISSLLHASGRERRALVVHQDGSVVEVITRILHEHGFEVTAAYDSRGAIEKAQEVQPSLVIVNALVSQLDDYHVLKALNYTNTTGQMDILVLSGEMPARDKPADPVNIDGQVS